MVSDISFIILLLFNGLISLAFFVLAIVYFFVEAKKTTGSSGGRTVLISALVCVIGLVNAILTRYAVLFPKIGGYDLNSSFTFVTNLASSVFGFFVFILYLRCGQHFADERQLPGSLIMKDRHDRPAEDLGIYANIYPEEAKKQRSLDWKWILIPIPFLIIWTIAWFGIFPPKPTELALATSPEGDGLMVFVYTFLTASIAAPLQEEILYRHFAMGLLYKWFGRGRAAIVLNISITTIIFAIAHAGVVTEDWIKIVQIIPAGLVFGLVNYKKGLEHSILSHSAFNTAAILLSMAAEALPL